MEAILLTLNEPWILWSLFFGAVGLVLVDYLFPVDWPAFVGYFLFSVFIGLTISASAMVSLVVAIAIFIVMLLLHHFLFSKYLTNAPQYERLRPQHVEFDESSASPSNTTTSE